MTGIIGSFSPGFYKKIASQPMTRSFGFLLGFILIISAVMSFQLTLVVKGLLPEASTWVRDNFESIIADLPDIAIENGELTLPQEPYMRVWNAEDETNFVVVIDPAITDYYRVLEGYDNALVLTRRMLVIKTTKSEFQHEIKTYELDNIERFMISRIPSGLALTIGDNTFQLTPASIKRFLERISFYVYPAGLVFFTLAYLFSKMVQVFFFSIASSLFNAQCKAGLNYNQLINIGIYAIVPGTLAAVIQEVTGFIMPFYWLVYCIIYAVYLYLGVRALRQEPVTVTGR